MADSTRPDGRRAQWLAMDAWYYDAPLGVALRDRFGIVGVVLFDAFLRACKRNVIQGRVTYNSVDGLLDTLGLPGLLLADEKGQQWDLDELWSFTGDRKVTSRRHRGRTTDVLATHWERWQNDGGRAREAERKRRERAENAGTEAGRSEDETPLDNENNNENENDSLAPPRTREERVEEALDLLAARDLERGRRRNNGVNDERAYRAGCRKNRKQEHGGDLHALAHANPDWTAENLADEIEPRRQAGPKLCESCGDPLGAAHTDFTCHVGQKAKAACE